MTRTPPHIKWLIDTKQKIRTADGKEVSIFEFCHTADNTVLSAWATYFRNHYCADSQIDALRSGTGKSRADYLHDMKFPSCARGFGPGVRSGDFTEILIADYLEFILSNWVPNRWKYSCKDIRDESKKGVDVIGIYLSDTKKPLDDILSIYEVKSWFSGKTNRLQDAVNDSPKDSIRKAETLNATKQRFIEKSDNESATKIERFQNINDNPFTERYGAVAVIDSSLCDRTIIGETDASVHPNNSALSLLVIKGNNMKQLVSDLYKRAADEA